MASRIQTSTTANTTKPETLEPKFGNVSVSKQPMKTKIGSTFNAGPKDKPHVEETDSEKKARKQRIIDRRQARKT